MNGVWGCAIRVKNSMQPTFRPPGSATSQPWESLPLSWLEAKSSNCTMTTAERVALSWTVCCTQGSRVQNPATAPQDTLHTGNGPSIESTPAASGRHTCSGPTHLQSLGQQPALWDRPVELVAVEGEMLHGISEFPGLVCRIVHMCLPVCPSARPLTRPPARLSTRPPSHARARTQMCADAHRARTRRVEVCLVAALPHLQAGWQLPARRCRDIALEALVIYSPASRRPCQRGLQSVFGPLESSAGKLL